MGPGGSGDPGGRPEGTLHVLQGSGPPWKQMWSVESPVEVAFAVGTLLPGEAVGSCQLVLGEEKRLR